MKKLLAILLAATMCVTLLAACGGQSNDTTDTNGDTTATDTNRLCEKRLNYKNPWEKCAQGLAFLLRYGILLVLYHDRVLKNSCWPCRGDPRKI